MKNLTLGVASAATITAFLLVGERVVDRSAPSSSFVLEDIFCEVGNKSGSRCLGEQNLEPIAIDRSPPAQVIRDDGIRNEPPTGHERVTSTESRLPRITSEIVASLDSGRPAVPDELRPLKVAFLGDQGNTRAANAVLRMIRAEGADMVLHQGDFDYEDEPKRWDAKISRILGKNFPYFASVGNHDLKAWHGRNGYQAMLKARLSRIVGARCDGDLGVRSTCTYKGLFFVLSGIGTLPKDSPDDPSHIEYLSEQLTRTDAQWRICSWHKNQRKMQTGDKKDKVGWKAYEICREAGAIIATGHEHAYARSHLLESFRDQTIASFSNTLVIKKGMSFVFVSGLGGHSVRQQKRTGAWWAATYTKDNDADHGALFCVFNAGGNRRAAECYFRDIRGRIADRFRIINSIGRDELISSSTEFP
jgi:hypothetical protein